METPSQIKTKRRAELESEIADFLKKGGKIKQFGRTGIRIDADFHLGASLKKRKPKGKRHEKNA